MNKDTVQHYINEADLSPQHEHGSSRISDAYKKAVIDETVLARWMKIDLRMLLTLVPDQDIDRRLLAERLWEPRYKTSKWYEIFTRHSGKAIGGNILSASRIKDIYKGEDPVDSIIQEYLTLRALKESYQAIRFDIFESRRTAIGESGYGRRRLAIELGEPRWRTSRIGLNFHRKFTMIHSSAEVYSLACKDVYGQDMDIRDHDQYKWEDENGIRTVSIGTTLHHTNGEESIVWIPFWTAKIPQAYLMANDRKIKDPGVEDQR